MRQTSTMKEREDNIEDSVDLVYWVIKENVHIADLLAFSNAPVK